MSFMDEFWALPEPRVTDPPYTAIDPRGGFVRLLALVPGTFEEPIRVSRR
jgi:hypothetical protein